MVECRARQLGYTVDFLPIAPECRRSTENPLRILIAEVSTRPRAVIRAGEIGARKQTFAAYTSPGSIIQSFTLRGAIELQDYPI
jgi:hypothetical protein